MRFDAASRETREAMAAATEGGFDSVERRQEAIARARAGLDEYEASRELLSGIEEEIVVADEQTTDVDMSRQRDWATSTAEGARRYVREERARLDAQEAALKELTGPGPIGQA